MTDKQRIKEATANFPATFGLRSFDGVFRISEESSYIATDGTVMLYTQRRILTENGGEDWRDFAKADPWELARNVTAVRCDKCFGDRIVDNEDGPIRCPRCKGTGHV